MDENTTAEFLTDGGPAPEADIITREQISVLWHLRGRLPEDVREMLVLRYMLGWQVKQIAQHLGISENNVSVTIRRALKGLQRDWPQEKDHE